KTNIEIIVLNSKNIIYAMSYLQEFINENIGDDQEEIDKRNNKRKKKRQPSNKEQRKLSYLFNFYTLAIARSNDIQRLCEMRNYEMVGYRNTVIHIYAYQSLLIEQNKHVAHEKV